MLVSVALLGTPAMAEGPGLKFGDARLHPYIDIEAWFDSAASLVNSSTAGSYETAGDLILKFRPGFKLEVPSSLVAFNWLGNFEYDVYTGVINAGTRNASHWGLDSDLDLNINKDGQLAVDIGDHVVRSDRNSSTPSLNYGTLSLFNEARLKLSIRPYNGSITIEPGYKFGVEVFSPLSAIAVCPSGSTSDCDPARLGAYDYMNHTVNLNGRWKFLPKTALILDSAFGARQYINAGSTNIMTLKAGLGVAGLLTMHWEVLLRVGWGQDFTANTYSSVIGQAEVGYIFSETGAIRLGYVRTFEPTGGTTYISFGDDRAYLDARVLLGGKFTVHGAVSFDYLSFKGATATMNQFNTSVDLGLDYEIKPWVNIGGGYRLSYLYGPDAPVYVGLKSFVRHEGFLKVQFIY